MDEVSTPRDGTVDKLLYDNLAEMIRLIPGESLMGQQTKKAFSFKKVLERSTMSKPGQSQLASNNSGKLDKDSFLWDTMNEKVQQSNQVTQAEEIPLLSLPLSHQDNGVTDPSNVVIQLRNKIQQLEQQLDEKELEQKQIMYEQESQRQAIEKSAQQTDSHLDARVERLENQLQQLQLVVQKVQDQLSEQHVLSGAEEPSMPKPGLSQLIFSKRGVADMVLDGPDGYQEEIPLLHISNVTGLSTAEIFLLQGKVQDLEQKLDEKESQLQDAEKNVQQVHLQLKVTAERFESQIQEKDIAIKELQNQLFRKQLEVINLQALLKKLELDIKTAGVKQTENL